MTEPSIEQDRQTAAAATARRSGEPISDARLRQIARSVSDGPYADTHEREVSSMVAELVRLRGEVAAIACAAGGDRGSDERLSEYVSRLRGGAEIARTIRGHLDKLGEMARDVAIESNFPGLSNEILELEAACQANAAIRPAGVAVAPFEPVPDVRLREIAAGEYGPNRQEGKGKAIARELLAARAPATACPPAADAPEVLEVAHPVPSEPVRLYDAGGREIGEVAITAGVQTVRVTDPAAVAAVKAQLAAGRHGFSMGYRVTLEPMPAEPADRRDSGSSYADADYWARRR